MVGMDTDYGVKFKPFDGGEALYGTAIQCFPKKCQDARFFVLHTVYPAFDNYTFKTKIRWLNMYNTVVA